ncbi:hypothetical protein LTR66_014132 [Elasticomyces elasticus]|nr:hypothetical protein LTR66_014132 [Elasticomyces elasticus]
MLEAEARKVEEVRRKQEALAAAATEDVEGDMRISQSSAPDSFMAWNDDLEDSTPEVVQPEPVTEPIFSFLRTRLHTASRTLSAASISSSNYDLDSAAILALFAPGARSLLQVPKRAKAAAQAYMTELAGRLDKLRGSTDVPTELAVWKLVVEEILPMAGALPSTISRESMSSFTVENANGLCLSATLTQHIPPNEPFIPLIIMLYPAALLLVLRTYLTQYPSSLSALSLHRKLKDLGTTRFEINGGNIDALLAGNIHLFNCLLELHWVAWRDLSRMERVLRQMNSSGVEANDETRRILAEVLAASVGEEKKWFEKRSQASTLQKLATLGQERLSRRPLKNRIEKPA